MTSYVSLNIESDIQTSQMDALELAKKLEEQKLALVNHILQMIMSQGQKTEDAINASANTTSLQTNSLSAPLTFVWPGDDTQPNPPFDSTIPPKEKGETDDHYYLRVLKKLEQIISWQKNHPTNINGESTLLNFMTSFIKMFPQGRALAMQYTNLMLTIMQNLIASVYVDSQGKAVSDAINEIKNLLNSDPSLTYLYQAFDAAGGFNIDTYNKKYSTDGQGKSVIDWNTFLLRAGGALASVCVNDLPSLMKGLYDKELEEIYKLYLACKNPFLYYLLLLSIIGQKQADTENNVAGCGDMLKLLAKGESAAGDAMSALSVLVNLLKGKTDDLNFLNTFVHLVASNPSIIETLKTTDPAAYNALKLLVTYGNIDLNDLDANDKKEVMDAMKVVLGSDKAKALYSTFDFKKLQDKITDWETNYHPDDAKKLAAALLNLQEMAKDMEALLPGIKESVKKFFGDKGDDGDFFKLTNLDAATLQLAATGDATAEKKLSDAIYNIVPKGKDASSTALSTINSDMNTMTVFYNDQNSLVQAQAQNTSSNDQKMISFIQEMYKQPGDFIKAIMQFMQKS